MRQHRSRDRGGRTGPRARSAPATGESTFANPASDDAGIDAGTDSSTDAGTDFFRRSGNRKADQKARQLCRQVYRTLSVALPGCGDEVLQDLTVVSVDPAPDAGHLLVTVSAGPPAADGGGTGTLPDILDRLGRAAGRLRSEVARDVVRKRAPGLAFRVLPRGEVNR